MNILTGNEHFTFKEWTVNKLLLDFWAWISSDLINNTTRGALAEFIVATSLGIDTTQAREDWAAFDLLYHQVKIEVKSSAYLQSWEQTKLSQIKFSISPSHSWASDTGYSEDFIRQSDLYVFCVYSCVDKSSANPLRLEDWDFYVLPTFVLNEQCGNQRTISLSRLLSLNPIKCDYEHISNSVSIALNSVIEYEEENS